MGVVKLNNNTKIMKVNKYRSYILLYGILAVLFVLEYFEYEEQYEECQKIIDSIIEHEKEFGIKLSTRMNDAIIKDVIGSFQNLHINKEDLLESSRYYSNIIIDSITESSL